MVPVEWAGPALSDLQEVHHFIARDSPRYARITIEKIQEAAARLGEFPYGHELPDLPNSPYRQILVGAYRVIYRVEESRILIMGVIHASRNLPPIMKERSDS